jgi:hypothetical protein
MFNRLVNAYRRFTDHNRLSPYKGAFNPKTGQLTNGNTYLTWGQLSQASKVRKLGMRNIQRGLKPDGLIPAQNDTFQKRQ